MKRQNTNFLETLIAADDQFFEQQCIIKSISNGFENIGHIYPYKCWLEILSRALNLTILNSNHKPTFLLTTLCEIWTCAKNRVVSMAMNKSQNQNKPVWAPIFEIEVNDRYFRKQKYNEKAFSTCFYFRKTKIFWWLL